MNQSTLTSKHQTTIPKAVVQALKLKPSDQLVYEIEEGGRVILTAKTGTFASVAAGLPRRAGRRSKRTVGEMNRAVRDAAAKRQPGAKS